MVATTLLQSLAARSSCSRVIRPERNSASHQGSRCRVADSMRKSRPRYRASGVPGRPRRPQSSLQSREKCSNISASTGRTWVGSWRKSRCRGCGTRMRTRAPGAQTRYSSPMMPRKVALSRPRCSSTCLSSTSPALPSGKGQGNRSRSCTTSGCEPGNWSTFTHPARWSRPQPRFSRRAPAGPSGTSTDGGREADEGVAGSSAVSRPDGSRPRTAPRASSGPAGTSRV